MIPDIRNYRDGVIQLRIERHYETPFGNVGTLFDDVGILCATREKLPDGIYHDRTLFGNSIDVGFGSCRSVLFHKDKALAFLKSRIDGKPIKLTVGHLQPLAV